MRRFGLFRVLKVAVMALVAIAVFGFAVERLWNWLMPLLFGLRAITFAQSLGLLLLSKILFGGFHRHGGGRRGRGWKERMRGRWAQMTPAERERFRAGLRCGGGWQREPVQNAGQDKTAEPSAV